MCQLFFDPRMLRDMFSFESVCLPVCNTLTFESLDLESSFLVCSYIFETRRSPSVYESHRVKAKVTGVTKRICIGCLHLKAMLLKYYQSYLFIDGRLLHVTDIVITIRRTYQYHSTVVTTRHVAPMTMSAMNC